MSSLGVLNAEGIRAKPVVQRLYSLWRSFSRALTWRLTSMDIARPVDGFKRGITRQCECEARLRSAIALAGKLPLIFTVLSALRFLIISEVCLTGCTFNHAVNMPLSLALTGFEGV